jgi:hypothetical protein
VGGLHHRYERQHSLIAKHAQSEYPRTGLSLYPSYIAPQK